MISSAKLIDSGNRRKLTGDSSLDLNASNGEITILNFSGNNNSKKGEESHSEVKHK